MDCIFCKIIKGEIPSEKIFENEEFIAILDAFPANKGHVLVLPKKHAKNAFEIDAELAARAFKLAVNLAKSMEGLEFVQGLNILQNNGEVAGQTVHHFHIHIIPRLIDDGIGVGWKPGGYSEGQASKYGDLIKENIKF